MHDWVREFWESIETTTKETDRWFQETSQQIEEVVKAIAQMSDDVSLQIQEAIATEIDRTIGEFLEPFEDPFDSFDRFDDGNGSAPAEGYEAVGNVRSLTTLDSLPRYLPPTPNHHPACIGCRHYHGYVYQGQMVVCGMHPYGWDTEDCPDWEAE
ncbi:hypothetical protein [Geitlerinema sp. PCC 9228]|jgi:hypothetical protein|uniref:hypothetical protein n=1 Tax=Geitlerinema sp. PCC 9228 TaxID=111611 RepID=UPI0008F991B2|nr:hypothetical protein [Geitlerinema sp. PCC 9228]